MDLDSMKYAELRSLAKELGLKANMKADKLLKLIKQHYEQEENKEEEQGQDADEAGAQEDENAGRGGAEESTDETSKEYVSSTAVFVNTRRGKGNGTKRKIPDAAAAAEGVTEEMASTVPGGARGAKKRKVSSVKDASESETALPTKPEPSSVQQQDEAPVSSDTEKASKVVKSGEIPRHQGLQEKKRQMLKPVTPNFKKLHEAHFNKMESIDTYVQRKTKQIETYRNAVKELKLSDKTKLQQADPKTKVKANQNRATMFSPVPLNTKTADGKRRHTLLSASKPPQTKPAAKEEATFRPTVLSTRRINVRFSEATLGNEHKRSLVKTPARMSPCVTSSTPKPNKMKTSTFSATKIPGPFVFAGNTSMSATPGTQKKPSFDLKASLSRPLTYKPHKGKLKPFGDTKETTTGAENKSLISNSHQKNYKQHKVQTREDRRAKHMEGRKQKKENMLGARRGLVMM